MVTQIVTFRRQQMHLYVYLQGRCRSLVVRRKRSMQMWQSLSTSPRAASPCMVAGHMLPLRKGTTFR